MRLLPPWPREGGLLPLLQPVCLPPSTRVPAAATCQPPWLPKPQSPVNTGSPWLLVVLGGGKGQGF